MTLNSKNTKKKQFTHPTKKHEVMAARIERIACKLYACNFANKYRREHYINQLTVLLLNYKNLKRYTPYRFVSGTVLDSGEFHDMYSGIVFTKCLNHALTHYGKVDKETNQRIPFLQLFSSIYKIKKADIIIEHAENKNFWNSCIKRDIQHMLWDEALAETGYSGEVKRFNFLNIDKLLGNLVLIGASDEYLERAKYNHTVVFTQADEYFDEDEETGRSASDYLAILGDEQAYNTMYHITKLLDRVKENAKAKKNKKVMKGLADYVTLRAREYLFTDPNGLGFILMDYVNEDLLNASQNFKVSEVDAYAAFQHKKHDTARKTLKVVSNYVAEYSKVEAVAA